MRPQIGPWDASALFARHPTLTFRDLYDRFQSADVTPGRRGLSSYLEDALITWAQETQGWQLPVKRSWSSNAEERAAHWPTAVLCRASAYTIKTGEGIEATASTLHIPSFSYSRQWAKSGTMPQQYRDQAQFIMALSGSQQHCFVVLVDKNARLYWAERDEDEIAAIREKICDLALRLERSEPPPLDLPADDLPAPVAEGEDGSLDTLCANWLAVREAHAAANTKAKATETTLKSIAERLKAAIPAGSHHEHAGLRIHHSARTGQISEEKLNVDFF